jgi:hypothetical protein
MVTTSRMGDRQDHDGISDDTSQTVHCQQLLDSPLASVDTTTTGVSTHMAKRTRIELVDDLDGTVLDQGDGETVTFSLSGSTYAIDLSRSNADALRSVLQRYITVGRRTGGGRSGLTSGTQASSRDYDPKAVRGWAESNNVDVPARGRIPAEILERYKAEGN